MLFKEVVELLDNMKKNNELIISVRKIRNRLQLDNSKKISRQIHQILQWLLINEYIHEIDNNVSSINKYVISKNFCERKLELQIFYKS